MLSPWCSVALALAAFPSFGAPRRGDELLQPCRCRRSSVFREDRGKEDEGLHCNFCFSGGLLCNLGMYCASFLIPSFLSQKFFFELPRLMSRINRGGHFLLTEMVTINRLLKYINRGGQCNITASVNAY